MAELHSNVNNDTLKDILCRFYSVTWEDVASLSHKEELTLIRSAYVYIVFLFGRQRMEDICKDFNRTRHAGYYLYHSFIDRILTNEPKAMSLWEHLTNYIQLTPNITYNGKEKAK